MKGCQLLINPDNVTEVKPGDRGLFSRGADGTVDQGAVWFRWTPPPLSSGLTIYAQLLVLAPGQTDSGYMLSPAICIEVGS